MTKTEAPKTVVVPTQPTDVNPDLAFREAWKNNVNNMRAVLTEDHQIRNGLRPSETKKAQEILRSFGL